MTTEEALAFLATGTRTGKVAWVASDGRPHVAPIWFIVEDGEILFNTGAGAGKARAMQRDPRISLLVDLEEPPYAFVKVDGTVEITEDPGEVLRVATLCGGRYMGADQAAAFGARNSAPGECLVRLRPTSIAGFDGISDWD
ncbi:MAG: PPOX class F420-dependent oxidoreductase [Acidimicrobiaceae bacterium]|nr:PPOX class F420-dependent oxidoreductase [Acidimicrobiaceae bacterium]MXZ52159.1 PPOX class F420-dependent oxidoreductase [Acidimicrobiaceae bacterium]MXZ99644.1 PPOX class F420-dependent oxidoreductase [Acidimicrobiaceae bacterium]MYE76336.1 PPOX class F420-dependent oxidoreductase [Acidimicrobiaceae bacterium]MYE76707.1 PPOX class F420-dependent oxidoreductase [Acidimicrobiaceae bacterium]